MRLFQLLTFGCILIPNSKSWITEHLKSSQTFSDFSSYDPVEVYRKTKFEFLTALGLNKFINGDHTTTLAPVKSQVRALRASLSSAQYYFNYSVAVSCESSLERWDCDECKLLGGHIRIIALHVNPTFHTKWMVTLDDIRNEIVVTFRQTQNLANVLTNLLFNMEKVDVNSDIKIHKGTLEAAHDDFPKIAKVLSQLFSVYPNFKVIFVGHSLGGSLATITVFLFKFRNVLPDMRMELYSSGQPRAGNRAFADFMNNLNIPSARIVNRDDFVTRLLPVALGYYHQHNELFLDTDETGTIIGRYCSTDRYEAPECGQSRGPILSVIPTQFAIGFVEHTTYFGVDATKCLQENYVEYFMQALFPLRKYLPKILLQHLPAFGMRSTVLADINYLVAGRGASKIFGAAIQKS